jgi:DNA repair exonuclease SbcCD ATPase subunit
MIRMIRLNNHTNLFTDVKKTVVGIQSKFENLNNIDNKYIKEQICQINIDFRYLNEKISQFDKINKKLYEDVLDLYDKYNFLIAENNQLKQENEKLKERLEHLEKENQGLKQENQALKHENQELKQEIKDLKQENKDLKQEIKELKQEIKELKQENQELKNNQVFKKYITAIQDLNQQFKLETKLKNKIELRSLRKNRIGYSHYIDNDDDTPEEIQFKLNILNNKLNSIDEFNYNKFVKKYGISLFEEIKLFVKNNVKECHIDNADYVLDWWEDLYF